MTPGDIAAVIGVIIVCVTNGAAVVWFAATVRAGLGSVVADVGEIKGDVKMGMARLGKHETAIAILAERAKLEVELG